MVSSPHTYTILLPKTHCFYCHFHYDFLILGNYLLFFYLKIQDVGGLGILSNGYSNEFWGVSVTRTGCGGIEMYSGEQVLCL